MSAIAARLPALGRRGRRMLAIAIGVGVLLLGAWLWLRDSALVAVNTVTVTGESGPDAGAIRSALLTAARGMTTLDVQMGQLRTAVSPYPVVKGLHVSTEFPHGIHIQVVEQLPVAVVIEGGRRIAVAQDGTLMHDVAATGSLPLLPLPVPPVGPRLTQRDSLNALALLAAAPYRLLGKISQVTTVAVHGLVAQLRSGPSIYFGDASALAAKWSAAAAVLANQGSVGASYVDVTDPARPAAGAA